MFVGGDSKTLMFVQISPSDQDLSETLSSLNFATRVRRVELGPVRKQFDTTELLKVKTMVRLILDHKMMYCMNFILRDFSRIWYSSFFICLFLDVA